MPPFAPASIDGVGKIWWNNPDLRELFDEEKTLVKKNPPTAAMAVADRWHAVHNVELIAPIISKMQEAHVIKTPYIEQLEQEVTLFHAWRESNGKLDESNPPKITTDETVIHLDASSIKKILICARYHYKRPHVPRDRESKKT